MIWLHRLRHLLTIRRLRLRARCHCETAALLLSTHSAIALPSVTRLARLAAECDTEADRVWAGGAPTEEACRA